MRLLLKDMLERKYRWPFVFFLLAATLYWWGAGQRDDHVKEMQQAFAGSLTAVFMLGPLFIALMPEPRAVWHLPISRRDHWRATWLLPRLANW